jgi:hypothetical protein
MSWHIEQIMKPNYLSLNVDNNENDSKQIMHEWNTGRPPSP